MSLLAILLVLLQLIHTTTAYNGRHPNITPCVCNHKLTCQRSQNCQCRIDKFGVCECTEPGFIYWAYCNHGSACCSLFYDDDIWFWRDRRNRMLETANAVYTDSQDEELQHVMSKCGRLDYQVMLYVDTHIYAAATPLEEATAAGCPFVVSHALFDEDYEDDDSNEQQDTTNESDEEMWEVQANAETTLVQTRPKRTAKEIVLWHDKAEGEALYRPDAHVFGHVFTLAELAAAHDQADANGAISWSGKYDAISNNCAVYIINLARLLGMHIDASVTAYVTRRLLQESGNELVERIRNSLDSIRISSSSVSSLLPAPIGNLFSSLLETRQHRKLNEATSGEELVQLLVETQAAELLA